MKQMLFTPFDKYRKLKVPFGKFVSETVQFFRYSTEQLEATMVGIWIISDNLFAKCLQKPLTLCLLREKFPKKAVCFSLHFAKRSLNPLCARPQILIGFIRRNHAVIDGTEPTGHDNPHRTGVVQTVHMLRQFHGNL